MALDFPQNPTSGQTVSGPNGLVWEWDGSKWVGKGSITGAGGGSTFPDAPSNNIGYGRYNASWTPVLMQTNDTLDGGNF